MSTQDTKYSKYSVTEAIPLPTFAQIGGRWSIFFLLCLFPTGFICFRLFFCLFFSANFFLSLWPIFFLSRLLPSRAGYGNFFLFPINFFLFLADFFFVIIFFARPPGMHIFGHILLLYTRFPIMNYLSKITIHYVNYK